jgi:hypothetical protein
MFKVTVRATSILVTPGQDALLPLKKLLDMHEYEDEYQETTNVLGYMYDEEHDVLYMHKGIDIEYLRRLLGDVEIKYDLYDSFQEMNYEFEEVIPPRDEDQISAIHFITGEKEYASNINDSQIFLVLDTGKGKTFCTGYGIGVYGVKTLIIMHRDNLRTQWVKSLHDLNGYTSSELYELTSSSELEAIANGTLKLDYDVYLMTHATFRAACNRIRDCEKIRNIAKNLRIGFKVIDEAHLEFRDTLLIDFLFNIKRNLYLTATDGRSSKDENAIFKHVFSNTTFYRKITTSSTHPDKWVEYITIDINTHCNPNIYRFRVNGGRGMSAITYGKWVIQHDKKHTHFKVCKEIIKQIYENEPNAKIIVFMPLIDLCTECAYFLNMELNNDESFEYSLDVKTVNSHNSKSENEMNKKADVIVTTVQSLGTGSDIKGITDIINCSPIVSKIVVKQVLGRIRYIPLQCHYYDIVDQSVPADCYWWKSRSRTLKSLTTKYTHLSWQEEETT